MLNENAYKLIEDYKKSYSKEEIKKNFRYLVTKGIEITAWQKLDTGERIVHKLFMDDLLTYEPEIRLHSAKKNNKLSNISRRAPLFLHSFHNRLIAEVKVIYVGEDHIFVNYPGLLYLWEEKRIPRIRFNEDTRQVGFKKQDYRFECPILDISNTGMAFKIKKAPAKLFSYEKDTISIHKIFNTTLKDELKGEVMYLKELDASKNEYRVGVKFESEIDLSGSLPDLLAGKN